MVLNEIFPVENVTFVLLGENLCRPAIQRSVNLISQINDVYAMK